MAKLSVIAALGAALLLTGSWDARAQEGAGVFDQAERTCNTDVRALCAGVQPGGGRVLACLQSHIGEINTNCSSVLAKAIWVARECAGDIKQFCPNATYGTVGDCMAGHLGQTSSACQSAMAYIASPAADRY